MATTEDQKDIPEKEQNPDNAENPEEEKEEEEPVDLELQKEMKGLKIKESDFQNEPKTKKSAFGKSLKKSFKAMNDNGGDLYAGVDSAMEDVGDKFVQKTGLFGKAVRAMHDNGGDLYSGLSVVGESLLKTILLFIPRFRAAHAPRFPVCLIYTE